LKEKIEFLEELYFLGESGRLKNRGFEGWGFEELYF